MEVTFDNVTKSFQKQMVIPPLYLTFTNGITALLGPNGSGKTTLLRMLVGNIKPNQGRILWENQDIQEHYQAYASVIGYMPQHIGMYPDFKVEEFLIYMSHLKGLEKSFAKGKIQELLNVLHLKDQAGKKIKTLSGGMLQRVGMAQALLNEPRILILDEPTAGLDPKERNDLKKLIAHLSKEALIIISTHIVSDIEHIADQIVIMKEGGILQQGTPTDILSTLTHKVFEVRVTKDESRTLEDCYRVVSYHDEGEFQRLRIVSEQKPHVDAIEVTPSLDDVYLYHFQEEDL